jgi:hypothetical protein
MKAKTSELIGPALDWAVAKCEGYADLRMNPHRYAAFLIMYPPCADGLVQLADLDYSTNWEQSGPIIEREQLSVEFDSHGNNWYAQKFCVNPVNGSCVMDVSASGPTPLIAACRCYVASKLGDEVELPEIL